MKREPGGRLGWNGEQERQGPGGEDLVTEWSLVTRPDNHSNWP